jgi:hypothetical protein
MQQRTSILSAFTLSTAMGDGGHNPKAVALRPLQRFPTGSHIVPPVRVSKHNFSYRL